MADRYPDYDVLDKWDSLSWNDQTREVVSERMAQNADSRALTQAQLATLRRLVERIAPQPEQRAPANTVALLIAKINGDRSDGYRHTDLPRVRECWQRGLDAIEAEARTRNGKPFADLEGAQADTVLSAIEKGEVQAAAWKDLPAQTFWSWRLLPDIVSAHWAQPSLWSHMGFGGPAGPRGYVRLGPDTRDGWEAKERDDG